MRIQTIAWEKNRIKIIDQTKLPNELRYIYIRDIHHLFRAIRLMRVRGAPALGAAGALGVALAAEQSRLQNKEQLRKQLEEAIDYLGRSRPTAVNLFWALERMQRVLDKNRGNSISRIKSALLKEAKAIIEEDRVSCRRMGRLGAGLIRNGDKILTLCNAGILATIDFGTALGVIYQAKKQKKRFEVFACETRPLLQGARLTAWELERNGIDVSLICDSLAATLMRKKQISKVFVGADRIARNGDVANKVGTYNLAVLAKWHRIPFYVVAPLSTFDSAIKTGSDIPIEQRSPLEITHNFFKKPIAPAQVKVLNPAFDITPHQLITAIVTEKGLFHNSNRDTSSAKQGTVLAPNTKVSPIMRMIR